jgi:uncharacterized RDD family membrane protein YckC
LNQDLVTPKLAGYFSRLMAAFIDGLIMFVPLVATQFSAPFIGPIILGVFYSPMLEASSLQATLGKRAMGIIVCDLQGQRITLRTAFIRWGMAWVSGCVACLGHLTIFFTPKRQTLHDIVADTIVVQGEINGPPIFEAWKDSVLKAFNTFKKG